MPLPKYSSRVTVLADGRWIAVLKGKQFIDSYGSLDDAVDALLMEESFACARIVAARADELEGGGEAATTISELKRVAESIRERAKQELAD